MRRKGRRVLSLVGKVSGHVAGPGPSDLHSDVN